MHHAPAAPRGPLVLELLHPRHCSSRACRYATPAPATSFAQHAPGECCPRPRITGASLSRCRTAHAAAAPRVPASLRCMRSHHQLRRALERCARRMRPWSACAQPVAANAPWPRPSTTRCADRACAVGQPPAVAAFALALHRDADCAAFQARSARHALIAHARHRPPCPGRRRSTDVELRRQPPHRAEPGSRRTAGRKAIRQAALDVVHAAAASRSPVLRP